jgi:putative ABC transport system permease protein
MSKTPFFRPNLDADVSEEFRFHLEAEVEELVAGGMTPAAARAEALRRFGDISYFKDRCRRSDQRRSTRERFRELFDVLRQDIRYTFRSLLRQPAFALVAIVTLGLGIGANTAIFSVVNGVLLNPLPYREPGRLVMLWETLKDLPQVMVSYPDYLDWRQRAKSFEDLGIYSVGESYTLTGNGEPENVRGALASGNLFSLLGVRPALGRLITPADDDRASAPVVVLGDGFWRRRYGADPGVVGKTLLLDGTPYTIVGVLPATMQLSGRPDLWLPVGLFAGSPRFVRANHPGLLGIGRLKPGVTLEQMRLDLADVSRQIRTEYPGEAAGIGADGLPLSEMATRRIRPVLVMLSFAVGLVLLLASANVANLLLGRAATRQNEFALRIAIGAGRGRLLRQLLTESVLLALLGGALGLALAWSGIKLLLSLRPTNVPRLSEIHIDGTTLLFALGVSLLTGVLFGVFPALQSTRSEPLAALRESGRGSTGGVARLRLRAGLTVAEVALALMLLVGAGLLLRSFMKLAGVDTGVNPRGITAGMVQLSERSYPTEARQLAFFEGLLARVRGLPGISAAAVSSDLPTSANWQLGVTFEGLPPVDAGARPLFNGVVVTPEYFSTVGLKLLGGRALLPTDGVGQPPVVLVSEAVAQRFYGRESPVGRRLKHGSAESNAAWVTIVGVVGDVKNDGITTLVPRGTIYYPFAQSVFNQAWLIVRSEAPAESVTGMLRRELAAMDKELPLSNVTTLDQQIEESVAQPRFSMLMLTVFAALALVLAAVGLYGVISYSVTQRAREIGVRIALGARRGNVIGKVVGQAMALTALGIGIGTLGSLAAGKLLAKLLYDVKATDPLVFGGVVVLLGVVALVAAGIPALRASRIDPVTAMRE